jgi:hypothetical protein
VLVLILLSHGPESSAAENKVCLVIVIEVGQNHSGSFSATKICVLASYLQKGASDKKKKE